MTLTRRRLLALTAAPRQAHHRGLLVLEIADDMPAALADNKKRLEAFLD